MFSDDFFSANFVLCHGRKREDGGGNNCKTRETKRVDAKRVVLHFFSLLYDRGNSRLAGPAPYVTKRRCQARCLKIQILKGIKVLEQRFFTELGCKSLGCGPSATRPYEYDGSLAPRTTCSFIKVVGQFVTSSVFSLKGTS